MYITIHYYVNVLWHLMCTRSIIANIIYIFLPYSSQLSVVWARLCICNVYCYTYAI